MNVLIKFETGIYSIENKLTFVNNVDWSENVCDDSLSDINCGVKLLYAGIDLIKFCDSTNFRRTTHK